MFFGKSLKAETTNIEDVRMMPARKISMAWNLFCLVAILLWPTDGAAQDSTFGQLICNVKNNGFDGYSLILSAAAYVMGAFLLLRSGLLMKRYADNPTQGSVMTPIAHALSGAFMMALPAFAEVVNKTVFKSGAASGGASACSPGAITTGGEHMGLDVMMTNFVKNIHQPVFILISVIAFIVGATFLVQALLRAAKSGADPRAADPKVIVSNLVFGSLLMALATTMPDMLNTLFGEPTISDMGSTSSIIQWSKITGSTASTTAADNAVRATLAFIQIIGGVAFLRGWLIMKKAVEGGQATIPQGLTHVIAGAMCINMDKMLSIIDNTFGTNMIG